MVQTRRPNKVTENLVFKFRKHLFVFRFFPVEISKNYALSIVILVRSQEGLVMSRQFSGYEILGI